MLSKNHIRHLSSLKTKKFRDEHHEFIAEGHKLVLEFVNSQYRIKALFATKAWIQNNANVINNQHIQIIEVSEMEMEKISGLSSPSPVLAQIFMPDHRFSDSHIPSENNSLMLALDDIRDPGNLGTIIRIADWFGVRQIFCSLNCVELYNPKVVHSTMGSITRVDVNYVDLAQFLSGFRKNAKGNVYGAFLDGIPMHEIQINSPSVLLVGNESRGISQELISNVSTKISIPSYGISSSGKAESLNAAVATGILCAEFRRQIPAKRYRSFNDPSPTFDDPTPARDFHDPTPALPLQGREEG